MALYRRDDSPFFWMCLTVRGRSARRVSTQIPWNAPSAAGRAELKRQALELYATRQAERVLAAADIGPKPVIALASYLDWYGKHVTIHKKGRTRELSMIRQLVAAFGTTMLVGELTRDQILEWRTKRSLEAMAGTVNRELDLLRAALTAAVPRYITSSPAQGLPRLKGGRRRPPPRVLTRDEETRVLAVLPLEDQAAVVCAIDTLLRAGSLLGLTWADDRSAYLIARDLKSGDATHEVVVSTRLRVALDAMPRPRGRYIFGHRRPKDVKSIELWRMFRDACLQAGVPVGSAHGGMTWHGLRHTGTTRLVDAGVPLNVVREHGNWKSMRQLERYAHPNISMFRDAVNAIGAGVVFTPRLRETEDRLESARLRG